MKALAWVAIIAGAIMLAGALGAWVSHSTARPQCTHGASSLGPVAINGATLPESATPVTETCLP